ncbi:MAG: trypsin-like peptidase domain-containing protein [Elusimicrobiota bacterium]
MMTSVLLSSLILSAAGPVDAAGSVAKALQQEFADTARLSQAAVVNISTIHEEEIQVVSPHFFFGIPDEGFLDPRSPRRTYKRRTGGVGSGFLIDASGHVITNDHVVREADEIKVTLTDSAGKEETLPGKVVGRDPNLDLAVVQIQAKRTFPHLKFGDSDKVRVGDWAIAIGSPFALQQTVTAGIISAVRQSLSIEGLPYPNLLQTDAAINQGNSGGPLLNIDGEVIGVNTAIYSPSGAFAGIGFAIPVNEVKLALEYLLAGRRSPTGWLGVDMLPVDQLVRRRFALPQESVVLVNSVISGSPAEKGGLRRGDVILKLDDAPIQSPQDLVAKIARRKPGSEIHLELFRKGSLLKVALRLGERPDAQDLARLRPQPRENEDAEEPERDSFTWEGVLFETDRRGIVRVARVEPASPLRGTLREGDVLRGIDGTEVSDISGLRKAAGGADLRKGAVFDVLRRGRPLYLSVRTG